MEQGHGEGVLHVVGHRLLHGRHRAAFARHLVDALGGGLLHFRVKHVGGDDQATGTAAGNAVEIDAVGAGELARVGGGVDVFGPRRRRGARRHGRHMGLRLLGTGRHRLGLFGRFLGLGLRRRGAGGVDDLVGAVHQIADGLAHRHGGILGHQRPGQVALAEHFHVHDRLVGLHLRDHVAALDLVTDGLLPAHQYPFGHGVGELGHLDDVGIGRSLGFAATARRGRLGCRRRGRFGFRLAGRTHRYTTARRMIGIGRQHLLGRGHQIGDGLAHRHGAVHRRQGTGEIALAEHLHVHDGLVGLHLGDHVTALDLVADVLLPAHHDPFGHGIGELGHLDGVRFRHVQFLVFGVGRASARPGMPTGRPSIRHVGLKPDLLVATVPSP